MCEYTDYDLWQLYVQPLMSWSSMAINDDQDGDGVCFGILSELSWWTT